MENMSITNLNNILQQLEPVIGVIKTNIIDNLAVIKANYELRKLQESTFQLLFDQDNSIYKTFQNLFGSYQQLRKNFNSIIDPAQAESELAVFIAELQDFHIRHLLTSRFLHSYTMQYRCRLVDCIEKVIREKESCFRGSNSFKASVIAKEEMVVNAHTDLLNTAFGELITNACKVDGNRDGEMLWIVEKMGNEVKLTIRQQAAFKNETGHRGGLHKEVIPIFEIFGKPGSLQIENCPFQIQVVFNQDELQDQIIDSQL
jgi:hypothetical protein